MRREINRKITTEQLNRSITRDLAITKLVTKTTQ